LYRIGAFFFYFGFAVTILSILVIASLYSLCASSGVPFPNILSTYATVIGINSLAGTLIALVSYKYAQSVWGSYGMLLPSLFTTISPWIIITQFIPAFTGITSAVVMAINLLPLPAVLKWGLASAAWTIVSASLIYFLMVKLGIAPML
jgi:hypothetical protein